MGSISVVAFRWLALLLLLVAAALLVGFGPPVLTVSDTPGAAGVVPADVARLGAIGPPPKLSAAAAILEDETTGQVIWSKNANQRRAMASTTKIMTALVALRSGVPLTTVVTIDAAAAYVGGSYMGIVPGERFTLGDLFYGLLLPSGNDASVAIAEAVSGSVPAFVAKMNATARQLGMTNTQYVNTHGLDAPGHYSSAADLAIVARAALADPRFAAIVRTREKVIPATDTHPAIDLHTTDQLLGVFPGADGVKTGTTDAAGECLVSTVTRHGRRLLAVVLGSADRYADMRALMTYGFRAVTWPALRLAPSAAISVVRGTSRYPFQAAAGTALVWTWLAPILRPCITYTAPLTGTITAGMPLGQLAWTVFGERQVLGRNLPAAPVTVGAARPLGGSSQSQDQPLPLAHPLHVAYREQDIPLT